MQSCGSKPKRNWRACPCISQTASTWVTALTLITSQTVGGDSLSKAAFKNCQLLPAGARKSPCYVPVDRRRKLRRVADAAARKRLLYARYMGWAKTTDKRPSLVGRAGEEVAHASLLAAANVGYNIQPGIGSVRRLLGMDVPGGPLDLGAHLITLSDGVPGPTVTLAIEAKNIREWIYPQAPEIFQLLDKASQLQLATGAPVLPVLVCRKAHYTAGMMAKQLGFFIAPANAQFILAHEEVEERLLQEVRDELGFKDLEKRPGPHPLLETYFTRSIPPRAFAMAQTFSGFAPIIAEFSYELRDEGLRGGARAFLMDQFCDRLTRETNAALGWR